MLIPLGTDRPLHRTPWATMGLMAVTVSVFAATRFVAGSDAGLIETAESESVWASMPLTPGRGWSAWWTYVSYAFLHASWMHVLGNMLLLWTFGPSVEDRLGAGGMLAAYLGGAAAAGAAHCAVSASAVVGASGAVAAVSGMFLVLFPRTNVRCIFFVFPGVFSVPAWWFLVFAIAKDFLMIGFWTDNVARAAHLGGYAAGMTAAAVLLATRVLAREECDLLAIVWHAKRRRDFRVAVSEPVGARRAAAAAAVLDAATEGIAQARAAVSGLLAAGDLAGAGKAFKALGEKYASTPGAAVLSRRNQLDLANHFFSAGDHRAAAWAYERFIETYPTDSEVQRVRLLLALLCARYLDNPGRAEQLLGLLDQEMLDEEQRPILARVREEIGQGRGARSA